MPSESSSETERRNNDRNNETKDKEDVDKPRSRQDNDDRESRNRSRNRSPTSRSRSNRDDRSFHSREDVGANEGGGGSRANSRAAAAAGGVTESAVPSSNAPTVVVLQQPPPPSPPPPVIITPTPMGGQHTIQSRIEQKGMATLCLFVFILTVLVLVVLAIVSYNAFKIKDIDNAQNKAFAKAANERLINAGENSMRLMELNETLESNPLLNKWKCEMPGVQNGGKAYFIGSEMVNRTEAGKMCLRDCQNSYLALPTSAEEVKFISSLIKTESFVKFYKDSKSGKWNTNKGTQGTNAGFVDGLWSRPATADENCATVNVNSDKLHPRNCNATLAFICEI